MNATAEFVASNRGHTKLIYQDYIYIRDRDMGDKTYWRCERCQLGSNSRRVHCPTRVHTCGNQVINMLCTHNHTPDVLRVKVHRALTALRLIAADVSLTPDEVIEQTMSLFDEETRKVLPTTSCLKRSISRVRAQPETDNFTQKLAQINTRHLKNSEAGFSLKFGDRNLNTPDVTLDSSNESSEECNANYVTYEATNSINNKLTNLYKKSNSVAQTSNESVNRTIKDELDVTKKTTPHENVDNCNNEPVESSKLTAKKRRLESIFPLDQKRRQQGVNKDILVLEYSSTKFSDVGGCENHLLEICKLVIHLKHPELYQRLGVKPPRGFLLHGPPGCGKTMLAHAVAGELDLPFIKVASTEIVSGVSGDSEQKIRDLFAQAAAFAPCILFLDEIDSIAPRRDTAQREMERRIVAQLYSCLDDLEKSEKPVMVIGATSRPDAIDPGLRRAGRFDKEIGLGMPDERSREKILEIVCRNLTLESTFNLKLLARLTPGYVGADLSALAREACVVAINRVFRNIFGKEDDAEWKRKLSLDEATRWLREKSLNYDKLDELFVKMDDFRKALKLITPSAKREGFATVPDVSWDDVGALISVRDTLKWSVLYPIKHPEAFEALGLATKPQGILLCGPPGCGKTLIAKAVANESGMNFISVKGPELLSMYVGESERAVRQVFQRAVNSSPCVIFFDELDALCPRRSDHDSSGSARVVNQLLTEMDGIEGRKAVFLIGATNRPDIIDPAIMRPGRLDKVLYVGFPNVDDKIDILRAITRNRTKPKIASDCDFSIIANDHRGEFYTGADLAALVHEAAVTSLRENMKTVLGDNVDEVNVANENEKLPELVVTQKHFDKAFNNVRPSVTDKERESFEKLRLKYEPARE